MKKGADGLSGASGHIRQLRCPDQDHRARLYRRPAVADALRDRHRRLLAGGVPAGAHTPATAFGADFVTQLPGCDLQVGAQKAAA